MKEGIKTLWKRVDKHFSEGDESNLSTKLIENIGKNIEGEYGKVTNRVQALLNSVYKDSGLVMDWRRDEIVAVFTKLLK